MIIKVYSEKFDEWVEVYIAELSLEKRLQKLADEEDEEDRILTKEWEFEGC
jgi:hypothetical protein